MLSKKLVDALALAPILDADIIIAHGNFAGFMTEPEEMECGDITYAGHAGLAISPYLILHAVLISRTDSLERFTKDHPDYEVWRKVDLSNEQRREIVNEGVKLSAKFYGGLKLLLHGLDRLMTWVRYYATGKENKGEIFFFRKMIRISTPVCHEIPGIAYDNAIRYRFGGLPPTEIDPDRIHDHVKKSDDWKLVRKVVDGKVLSPVELEAYLREIR